MRVLSWIITLPIVVVAVLFAISNRGEVVLALWPLPFTLEAPLYLAALVALLAGFLAGGIVTWLAQHRNRRRASVLSDRAARLERELAEARARASAAEKRVAEMTVPVSGAPRAAGMALPMPPGDRPRPPASLH